MEGGPIGDELGRSRVVRRVVFGEGDERVVNNPYSAVVRPAASSLIVQRPATRSPGPFILMFVDADNNLLSGHWFDTLTLALESAAEVAGVRAEDWQIVSESFGNVPTISAKLLRELRRVPASRDGAVEYRPCRVRLRDGSWRDGVYIQDLETYLDNWVTPPGTDRGRYELAFGDVVEIADSPRRLPPHIASALYDAGESTMGGCCFVLVTGSGRRIPCRTGNFVDFVDLPENVDPAEIMGVEPHADEARTSPTAAPPIDTRWAVYAMPD